MYTIPDPLELQIRRASLLSDDRKEQLLTALPTLNEQQRKQLQSLLDTDIAARNVLVRRVISGAEDRGNAEGLTAFGEDVQRGIGALRVGEESAVKQEDDELDSLLDDA
jgi:hypothetical protein